MIASLGRNVLRIADRFRNVTPPGVMALYARAIRLHALKEPQPGGQTSSASNVRIVVSMTTIPERARQIGPTIASLMDQTVAADRFVLAYPDRSRRSASRYPEPESLRLPTTVEVMRCRDEGPATKLLPVLRNEPDALIVVVDDDVIYPKDFLAVLHDAHLRRPHDVCAYRGVRLHDGKGLGELRHVLATGVKEDAEVDIVFGTWGYAVPSGAVDVTALTFEGYPEAVRWVDDVWVSGHLARQGVTRVVVPARRFPIETLANRRHGLTHGPNRDGRNDAVAIAAFEGYWKSGGATS